MKIIIGFIIGQILMFFWFNYSLMPKKIERRAKDLGIMRYNGELDKFVPKDSIHIRGVELNYLLKGNTK